MYLKETVTLTITAVLIGGVLMLLNIFPGITTLLWELAFVGIGWVIWCLVYLRKKYNIKQFGQWPTTAINKSIIAAAIWVVFLFVVETPFWEYINRLQGRPVTTDCETEWTRAGPIKICK